MKAVFRVCFTLFTYVVYADEDVSQQIWGNVILGHPYDDKVYLELDFEPKSQLSGTLSWRNLDLTPLVEYYPNRWVDLAAEAVTGYTKDSYSAHTYEVSPRIGIRFHILGNIRQYIPDEYLLMQKRFSFSTFVRYEYRSLYYDDGHAEHQSRFRIRLETKTALNHQSHYYPDTWYLFGDFEEYFNLGEDMKEVFLSKTRIRIGPGYTFNRKNRFEILGIYDFANDTYNDSIRHDAAAIDFRYKLFF